jgi:hypothetical protein
VIQPNKKKGNKAIERKKEKRERSRKPTVSQEPEHPGGRRSAWLFPGRRQDEAVTNGCLWRLEKWKNELGFLSIPKFTAYIDLATVHGQSRPLDFIWRRRWRRGGSPAARVWAGLAAQAQVAAWARLASLTARPSGPFRLGRQRRIGPQGWPGPKWLQIFFWNFIFYFQKLETRKRN